MKKDEFSAYLKSARRSHAAIQRSLNALDAFTVWLDKTHDLTIDDNVSYEMLSDFIQSVNKGQKNLLMGLANLFEFQGKDDLKAAAVTMRREMLDGETKPMALQNFIGISPDFLKALKARGIQHTWDLLSKCRTPTARAALSEELCVSSQELLDLVKMADLSRLFAVKAVRTRLYLESGFDTLDKLAAQDPMELHLALVRFVEESHFDGIPTTPKEAEGTVKAARELERWIVFEESE